MLFRLATSAIVVGVVALPTLGGGLCDWQELALNPQPAAIERQTIAYHEPSERVVLINGLSAANNNTWIFDGAAWMELAIAGPSVRFSSQMVYDSVREECVLFGGTSGSSSLGDTWIWNGVSWTERVIAGPSPRNRHGMAFDSVRGEIVLFGGSTANGANNETWTWDGAAWTQRFPATSPPARFGHAMTFDENLGVAIVFGGSAPGVLGDCWLWNGVNWSQYAAPAQPPGRIGGVMTYLPQQRATLLFGGQVPSLNDVWRFENGTWSEVTLSGGPRIGQNLPMAYDTSRGKLVLCGRNDALAQRTYLIDLLPLDATTTPLSQVKQAGDSASLEVQFAPTNPPIAFQWSRNGVALADGPDVSGATGAQLMLTNLTTADTGVYTVRVLGQCDDYEYTAVLTVLCPGDSNGDGIVNFADLNLTVSNFNMACPAP